MIIYQLLFGGQSPFAGKWIGAGETPETNELIRRGLWLYAPNSLIQPVDRTIPLEIVHPEVRRCFLKCFNDGYQNSNLRPTAEDWVKALRLAVNELTICGKVNSHYYSRTYGKCYWCDRSIKLGIDIFLGKVSSTALSIPASKTITNATIPANNKQKYQALWGAIFLLGLLGFWFLQSQTSVNYYLQTQTLPIETTSQPSNSRQAILPKNTSENYLLHTLQGHSNWVWSVAYSPDGKTLASGSRDETIKLWDVDTGAEKFTLKGHSGWVTSVAFSPDGQTLASGSHDNTIRIWNVDTGEEIYIFKGHSNWVWSVAYSPDGKTLASASGDGTIKLWNVSEIRTLQGDSQPIMSVTYSPDGNIFASGSNNGTIKLWNVATRAEISTLQGHSDLVISVAFSPDGKTLASGSGDNTIKLWDVATGEEIRTLKGHSNYVYSVTFSPDGKTLASGSADDTIKLWNVVSGEEILNLHGHFNSVTAVAFSADGKNLASAGGDKTIKIWRIP
ncbi:MAG: WD40 repeat domain-containing protein [Nostoc sp.]